jgi:predicted nucleic acid-binding protein
VLRSPNSNAISDEVALRGPVGVPAHFEADAYAGLRHMHNRKGIDRDELLRAVERIGAIGGGRAPLAPLLGPALDLVDRLGAHDAFYVALAAATGAPLLTSDGAQARAAERLGITVVFRPVTTIG